MGRDEQDLVALRSAEQQLLNAAGAARVAARRISDREEAELEQVILRAAHTLEEAAHRIREQRRALLARWQAAEEITRDQARPDDKEHAAAGGQWPSSG